MGFYRGHLGVIYRLCRGCMGVIEFMQEYRTPKRMQWKLGSIGIYMAWD